MSVVSENSSGMKIAKLASLEVAEHGDTVELAASGDWVASTVSQINANLREVEARAAAGKELTLDLKNVGLFDTSGAWLVARLRNHWIQTGGTFSLENPSGRAKILLDAIRIPEPPEVGPKKMGVFTALLFNLGKFAYSVRRDAAMAFNIVGAAIQGPQLKNNKSGGIRPTSIVHHIDRMGIRAVPIILLMSFLIGAVVAQQAAFQLRTFGLEVWSADLVGALLLREIGVLLTAIMIAGRSGSSMTAEIGSMKMREEVDALTVIGLNPIGVLVFPRLVALTIVLPLLTFLANMSALAGAALILRFYSDVPVEDFISRVRAFIDLETVFAGLMKAPFMGIIIGVMAAVEGLKVEGSAESLGRRTTAAVVKSIFFVILVDSFFAVFYAAIDY